MRKTVESFLSAIHRYLRWYRKTRRCNSNGTYETKQRSQGDMGVTAHKLPGSGSSQTDATTSPSQDYPIYFLANPARL